MIRTLEDRLTSELLAAAADRFDLDSSGLELLEGYENIIYADEQHVLRISHDSLRQRQRVLGELRFIAHLAAGGASVAAALHSRQGELIEGVADGQGGHFLITCYRRAPGHPVTHEDAGPELFESMGRLMAELHTLGEGYRPENDGREAWYENEHVTGRRANLPAEEVAILERIEALYETLRSLPQDPATFGLIHADIHSDNLLWDGSQLTLIDFDDCMYAPFGMDLGTALYYANRFVADGHEAPAEHRRAVARKLLMGLLRGYRQVRPPDAVTSRHLKDFLLWRQMDLYLWVNQLRVGSGLDSWEQEILVTLRERIDQGVPTVELDDAAISEALAADL